MIQPTILTWLLEETDLAVRYRTLREVTGCPDDSPELDQLKAKIAESNTVQTILAKMHPDGYWLQKNPQKKEILGDGVLYGSFGTTHFVLAYLAEMGVDRSVPQVDQAATRYLSLQQPDGDWLGHYSCLIGYNIRTFTLLGYRDDPHIKRAIDLLLTTPRDDGGYLCDFHEGKYKSRQVKSCIRGAAKSLLAFAEYPEYWDHPRVKELVDYFLNRGGIFRTTDPAALVNMDMERMSFPITWRANCWEILYGLSKMGLGRDDRLAAAWTYLDSQAQPDGRYTLDFTPAQSPWKVGPRGEANKWVTFYVEAARAYRDGAEA